MKPDCNKVAAERFFPTVYIRTKMKNAMEF